MDEFARKRPAWNGFIHPATIVAQVRNTAPFLPLQPGGDPNDFVTILATPLPAEDAALFDYFALCLAAHHATVATFVPTDVDSKIRGLLWRQSRDRGMLRAMADLALSAMPHWSLRSVSRRWNIVPGVDGPVSGHNGEWFSVMAGAHGRFLVLGDAEYAAITGEAIHAELDRQSRAFAIALRTPGKEIDTLQLAMSITHNLGDLDQGISFWEGAARQYAESRERFGRLAHENTRPYGGILQKAARLYKDHLSAEGHRNYPLRAVRPLRQSPDLLLPLAPFLDHWGGIVATHRALAPADRAEVMDALVKGCRKVAGQVGYYRALAGVLESAGQREFDRIAELMPAASRKELRGPEMRQRIAVPRRSFESALSKRVAAIRASLNSGGSDCFPTCID